MLGDDTTAQRLRLIQAEFTQHERRGPGDGRTATRTEAPAPIDLGTLDYMANAVAEVVEHMRAVEPAPDEAARPRPQDPADAYEWWRHGTAHLDAGRQQAREAIIYRQGLEHAIAMGDTSVIRKHFCPECGCLGLYWQAAAGKAVCVNHYCTDDDGMAHAWSLARIARHHIASKETVSQRAT